MQYKLKMTDLSNHSTKLTLALSPAGNVYLTNVSESQQGFSKENSEKIQALFNLEHGISLLRLGLINFTSGLPSSIVFWRSFAQRFIVQACRISAPVPLPRVTELQEIILQAPFMVGGEYLNIEVLGALWNELNTALMQELTYFAGNLQNYFNAYNPNWNLVGRVCFHLAENKDNSELPFAFLATYTTHLSSSAKVQHLPLGRALQEYAGEKNKPALLALLLPVQKAAEQSKVIHELVVSNDIFQPQAWQASEAHRFLKDIPYFEAAGVVVRVPNWWNVKKPPRPQLKIAIGQQVASTLGMNALLDFDMQFALSDGEKLTSEEWNKILASTENLIQIKGQWVEVDRDKLQQVLTHWQKIQRQVNKEGLSFAEGLRLLSGATSHSTVVSDALVETLEWSSVIAGDWLQQVLQSLRNPEQANHETIEVILKKQLTASLRPYQFTGVQWLWLLYNLKLGGCLADDMGLGKTIQLLSLLLLIKHHSSSMQQRCHLLVIPASLLGNWQAEIERFTPDLKIIIAHSSIENLKKISPQQLTTIDLVITTYSLVHRLDWISSINWDVLILDEAQMIKNPSAKQTQAVKKINSQVRFTLTGTPIENRLADLWSLFDFTAPGLLGSSKVFNDYGKSAKNSEHESSRFYAAIRTLVSPYILRRLKNDKRIIADLPDKTELQTFCTLTKEQVALYQQAVTELSQQLENVEGIKRRGLVLGFLLRFKQICNHPTQWLGHGHYTADISGKFLRLKEICEQIAVKQEKILVFTQFREIIPALAEFLAGIFQQPGLVLHGNTAIKQRSKLVDAFQQEQGPPFFILSLKAGGTGLNLTRASHVIHFDRWWNPAVENQATDRAYRIGQKRNVLVHKFICRGTIEEKIDALIMNKKTLSNEILASGDEMLLTEMDNHELLKIVALDIHHALAES